MARFSERRIGSIQGLKKGAKGRILCENRSVNSSKAKPSDASPLVTFRESDAGRETLAAIAEDRLDSRNPLAHRGPESTQHYGDRISNAPGALSPKIARALDDAPEVSFQMVSAGLRTHHALSQALREEAPEIEIHDEVAGGSDDEVNVSALEIERGHPFVVRVHPQHLQQARARKRLLETRLLPILAPVTKGEVTRLTVEALEGGTSLVTVWTQVALP